MKKLYHIYNEQKEITHASFFEVGKQPVNSTLKKVNGEIKPMYNDDNDEIYEGATEQEKLEAQEKATNDFVNAFLEKKKSDGLAYATDVRFRITKELIGKPVAEVNEIDGQCKESIIPLLQFLEGNGADFWTAMNVALQTTDPVNSIVLNYFNEVKTFIINYVQTNYPKEL